MDIMKLAKSNKNIWFPSIFDELFTPGLFETPSHYAGVGFNVPAVNIKENETSFEITLAAPGKKKEDFNIELEENILTISSEKTEKKSEENKDEKYTRKEFSYASFKRSFTLPETIDEENIAASYDHGVLAIRIPKKEEVLEDTKRFIEIS